MNWKVVLAAVLAVAAIGGYVYSRRQKAMDFGPGPEVETTQKADEFAIVEYGTTRCPACGQLKGILNRVNGEVDDALDIEFVYLDKDQSRVGEAQSAGMGNYVPFLVVYDAEDNVVWTHTGALPPAEIKKEFIELGILKETGGE